MVWHNSNHHNIYHIYHLIINSINITQNWSFYFLSTFALWSFASVRNTSSLSAPFSCKKEQEKNAYVTSCLAVFNQVKMSLDRQSCKLTSSVSALEKRQNDSCTVAATMLHCAALHWAGWGLKKTSTRSLPYKNFSEQSKTTWNSMP